MFLMEKFCPTGYGTEEYSGQKKNGNLICLI